MVARTHFKGQIPACFIRPEMESGYYGVYRDGDRYRAKFEKKHIGYFTNKHEAAYQVYLRVLGRAYGVPVGEYLKIMHINRARRGNGKIFYRRDCIIPRQSQRMGGKWVCYVWEMGELYEISGDNVRGTGSGFDECKQAVRAAKKWLLRRNNLFTFASLWRS